MAFPRTGFARLSRDALAEVRRVQAGLPEGLKEAAAKVPVICKMQPGRALLEGDESEDELLGLFVGEACNELAGDNPIPPQIYLFLANIWDYSGGDPRAYLREVRKTYLHEIGHYIGIDENGLEERGME
jgi:predicted Zn-dependent protease with MMP-like domain